MRASVAIVAGFLFVAPLTLCALVARADGLSDASAGLTALNAGEYAKAVTLLTRAISNGKLGPGDLELAYVKRAQAYIGEKLNDLALVDLKKAKALRPEDAEIDTLQAQAEGKSPGPSLSETIATLEKNLVNSVNYVISGHNMKDNSDFVSQVSRKVTNVTGDQGNCSLKVQGTIVANGGGIGSFNLTIDFDHIQYVTEMSVVDNMNLASASGGRPEIVVKSVNPPVSVINVSLTKTHDVDSWPFYFVDEDAAQQVGKAFQHAADLCRAKRPN
jgi:hypothetical protein